MRFTLRNYQRDGVQKLRASYASGRKSPLFVLPTGGGKTAVFSHVAESAVARGNRVVILVHRQELLLQASRSLARIGVSHGLVAPQFAQSNAPVQVASVQTLVRRLDKFAAPDLIIVDEAHHAISPTYQKIFAAYPKARILGVTATPCRTNGDGLDEIFDDLILGPSIEELIGEGFLVPPTVYAPPVGLDLTGVKKAMGDYEKKELSNRLDKPSITGSAVEHYLKLARGEPGIAFCVSVAHAEHVAEEFRAHGIRAVRVDGGMDDAARRAAIEGLGNGSVDIVTSADLIGEGVDVPRCSVAILLRPTHSLALYLQQVGRVLRPFEGKSRSLVLDHVGNVMRHGFPDDPQEWSLKGTRGSGRAGAGGPTVRISQCEKCFFVFEAGPECCPKCGHAAPARPRQIEQKDGELEKLSKEAVEAARKAKRVEVGKAKSLEDLIAIGRSRGYANPAFWAQQVHGARSRKGVRA